MKYIITFNCFFFVAMVTYAQTPPVVDHNTKTTPNNDTTYFHEEYYRVFTKVQQEPTFKGGDSAWRIFQSEHLKYPEEAKNERIQGTVIVRFIVQPDGHLTDFEISSGPEELYKAAINLMKASPAWNPAKVNHFIVRAYKTLPIIFKLPEE